MNKTEVKTSKHHRRMRSHNKSPKIKDNVVTVRDDLHRAFHLLFNNAYPWEVAEILNKVWINPQYKLICIRREK